VQKVAVDDQTYLTSTAKTAHTAQTIVGSFGASWREVSTREAEYDRRSLEEQRIVKTGEEICVKVNSSGTQRIACA
jgi:hypothetical protein